MTTLRSSRSRAGVSSTAAVANLKLPAIFILCCFFFLAGFFGSTLLSLDDAGGTRWSRPRKALESYGDGDGPEFVPMPHGESGESSLTRIPFQVLSWKPRALYFPNFATAEQCQSIIEMAKSGLTPSALALRKGETQESTRSVRTSSGMFISSPEDKSGTLALIEEKIARATLIPRFNGEEFNILRYQIGEKYDSHYDAFHAAEYGEQKNQRVASFLLYLSDVEEGGETMFPIEDGLKENQQVDYRTCMGLKIKPRRGDGLLFHSLFPNGTIDPASLHGSCPVIKGEKWVATKWIGANEQLYY